MKNYSLNQKNKTIIIDMDNVTDNEMRLIQTYVAAGYILKEKKRGLTYKNMLAGLKDKPEALEELKKKIAAKENYMIIKKFYLQEIGKKSVKKK